MGRATTLMISFSLYVYVTCLLVQSTLRCNEMNRLLPRSSVSVDSMPHCHRPDVQLPHLRVPAETKTSRCTGNRSCRSNASHPAHSGQHDLQIHIRQRCTWGPLALHSFAIPAIIMTTALRNLQPLLRAAAPRAKIIHAAPSRRTIAQSFLSSPLRAPSTLRSHHYPSSHVHLPASLPRALMTIRSFATSSHFSSSYTPSAPSARIPRSNRSSRYNSTASSSSSSSASGSKSQNEPEPEPTSAYGRFKQLSKKYGWYAVGVYLALSVVDYSLTLAVVHAVGLERVEPPFRYVLHEYRKIRYGEEEALKIEEERRKAEKAKEANEKAESEKLSPDERKKKESSVLGSRTFWAEAALAYAIHKTLILPVRAGLTVAITPKLVKWMAARGWVGKVSLQDTSFAEPLLR